MGFISFWELNDSCLLIYIKWFAIRRSELQSMDGESFVSDRVYSAGSRIICMCGVKVLECSFTVSVWTLDTVKALQLVKCSHKQKDVVICSDLEFVLFKCRCALLRTRASLFAVSHFDCPPSAVGQKCLSRFARFPSAAQEFLWVRSVFSFRVLWSRSYLTRSSAYQPLRCTVNRFKPDSSDWYCVRCDDVTHVRLPHSELLVIKGWAFPPSLLISKLLFSVKSSCKSVISPDSCHNPPLNTALL